MGVINMIDIIKPNENDEIQQCKKGIKMGTSGYRAKTECFKTPHLVEFLTQSIISVAKMNNNKLERVLIGGDGRYYNDAIIERVAKVVLGNQVKNIHIALDGIATTPACSAYVIGNDIDLAFICTASHNPAGVNGDCGLKINLGHGEPAPTWFTEAVHSSIQKTTQYYASGHSASLSLDELRSFDSEGCTVVVKDVNQHWYDLVSDRFMIPQIADTLEQHNAIILLNPMYAATSGLCMKLKQRYPKVFDVMCGEFDENFGDQHPEPDLSNTVAMQERMKEGNYFMGVAFDGDGDRCMFLHSNGTLWAPHEILAFLAYHSHKGLLTFKSPFRGVARSFPTAPFVDAVCKDMGLEVYDTPTGWKYFGELLDNGLVQLCGEESFGIGSDLIREKDGLWTCLAVLSIITKLSAETLQTSEHLQSRLEELYGHFHYRRWDYMVDSETADSLMNKFKQSTDQRITPYSYTSPVTEETSVIDNSYICKIEEGTTVSIRKSGTATGLATIRLYISVISKDEMTVDAVDAVGTAFHQEMDFTSKLKLSGPSAKT